MQVGSRVEFHSLGGDKLEGRTGTIVGTYANIPMALVNFWIAQVDNPPDWMEGSCIVMTDACMKEID